MHSCTPPCSKIFFSARQIGDSEMLTDWRGSVSFILFRSYRSTVESNQSLQLQTFIQTQAYCNSEYLQYLGKRGKCFGCVVVCCFNWFLLIYLCELTLINELVSRTITTTNISLMAKERPSGKSLFWCYLCSIKCTWLWRLSAECKMVSFGIFISRQITVPK